MDVREFDFELPPDLIAQEPTADRGAARLLHVRRDGRANEHRGVGDLPALLRAGDVLVVNDTRVFPARLLGRRLPSGGAVECLLIGRLDADANGVDAGTGQGRHPEAGLRDGGQADERWEALMHPGQRLGPGARVVFEGPPTLHAEVVERRFHGRRVIRLWTAEGSTVERAIDIVGHVPLPPYIKRLDRPADRDRYQTVFARRRGSVAAPTAGLHLTRALLADLDARGVILVEITLHVGYGTFQPVRVERVEDHRLEPERFWIGDHAAAEITRARREGRRIVAVGTTTTRALEAVALLNDGRFEAGAGTTDLFIHPGFEFRVVSGLMTNFHLPRSSLLMLVAAFAGRDRVLAAYAEAVRHRYRFYSYGDAMVVF
jgi:S-adenosylmethionine:tRNA ribosyltransferase-isomerase